MINHFRKIISAVILVTILTAAGAQAQTEVQTYSNSKFSREELVQMLAPIALYPDALLSQFLIAASYPFEVAEAERWLAKNPGRVGESLDNALKEKNWDVSVLSLCQYPKIMTMMVENLNWTSRIGDAFVNQQQDVMDAIQELRTKAHNQGNLTTTSEQKVIVEERIIRIEPAVPDYIYIPVYDPYVIYGPWWYPAYQPFSVFYPGVVVSVPGIVFSPRLFVGFGVIGWSVFNWPAHNVVIVNIDRTKMFYGRAHLHRNADRVYWRPDSERRIVRERRTREIPQFRPPGRSIQQDSQRDQKNRGGKDVAPSGIKPGTGDRGIMDRDKRPDSSPRVPEQDRSRQREPRITDKDKPVIRDRGARMDYTPQSEPARENKVIFRNNAREDRPSSLESRGERPGRSMGGGRGSGGREERR
jgi:hypothetical protein